MVEELTGKQVRVNVNPLLLCLVMLIAGALAQAVFGVFPSRNEGCQCSEKATPVRPLDHQRKIGSEPGSQQ